MSHAVHTLVVETRGPGLVEITPSVRRWVAGQGVGTGLLRLWCRHTSASLLVQENASPDVRADLQDFFAGLAPQVRGRYRHTDEGADDMPAHIRAALTQPGLYIPVVDGAPMLGTWQGVFVFEHRDRPHRREVVLHVVGEPGSGPSVRGHGLCNNNVLRLSVAFPSRFGDQG